MEASLFLEQCGDFGRMGAGCQTSADTLGGGRVQLKKPGFGVCLSSCCAPDWLGPQASHLEKNNLFPQRELCGLAEMV